MTTPPEALLARLGPVQTSPPPGSSQGIKPLALAPAGGDPEGPGVPLVVAARMEVAAQDPMADHAGPGLGRPCCGSWLHCGSGPAWFGK
ncbi:MAG: hypothetical protein F4074_06805 [Synechococcus sp. SB0672_bin_10]|nr:hypothetical protein [Synechococcus sp. SB0672_bin_10]